MRKKALLIGSETAGLNGVHTDISSISEMLIEREFCIDRCTDSNATRAVIIDRYKRLIHDTQTDDVVVIYYSGHGALVANPDYKPMEEYNAPAPRYYQFIVPTDLEESNDNDFRGILNIELSLLLAELTEKTKNVTVIMDCCHAARMSRDLNLAPKALPRPWHVDIKKHLRQIKEEKLLSEIRHVESNVYAVRLVAAAPNQAAYEYSNSEGQRIGILTESFIIALKEAGETPITWSAIGKRVRERVISLIPSQRPEVEGPINRLLFKLRESEPEGILAYFLDDNLPSLRGGRILGVNVGDEYLIMPPTVPYTDSQEALAHTTVTTVLGAVSRVSLALKSDHVEIPDGSPAFPIRSALRKRPVIVRTREKRDNVLIEAINASPHLIVTEKSNLEGVIASVQVEENKIELRDPQGFLLVSPSPFSPQAVQTTVENLQLLARTRTVMELESGTDTNYLDSPYTVEWGLVKEGNRQPLPDSGALLYIGDQIYVRVHNCSVKTVYASIFDVGLNGKITLLTTSEPSGIELNPGEDYVLGYQEHSGLLGLPLSWPESLPKDHPRMELFLVIISDLPQDLRVLETASLKHVYRHKMSQLQQLLFQLGHGSTRDLKPLGNKTSDIKYSIEHINFLLHPSETLSRDESEFLIDERPESSFLALSPKKFAKPPVKVAARLTEMVVHSNRALFSTDIRVDAMVITNRRAQPDITDFYQAGTMRFSGVKDGDRLSFENLLVYHGPVEDYLDFAVWVSRDHKESLSLAEMFKTQLNSKDFKKAALVLTTLAVSAPQAAAIVGAVGAAATLMNIAYRLLMGVIGKSIGLYRTSLLAHEGFGVGRHPKHGLMRSQDFSFGYEIIDLG